MSDSPLLSAVLIVRDEAEFIADCLASLVGVVDEIVVVDTGSKDETPEIAERFGALVVRHPWRDDFSEARNVSLEHATGRWILYIDADERLLPCKRSSVEELLEHADEVAFRIFLQPNLAASAYREYRLWRNDPRIRFDGIIHEKVVPAIHRVADSEGRAVGKADLTLIHLGYEGDQTKKHLRNLPLLKRQLAVEPSNLFAWNHLARVLTALGDSEGAEDALTEVIEQVRASGSADAVACLSYSDLLHLRSTRGEDVTDLLAEARSLFPYNCVLLWFEARVMMSDEDYGAALELLDQILEFDSARDADDIVSFDKRLLRELPLSAKGVCLFRIGDYEGSAAAYDAAAECAPTNFTYPLKRELARARARDLAGE